jgi:GMP synthase (glutamine-hydrolysing)
MSRPLLIVKTGSTMPHLAAERGDYEDWIAAGVGRPNVEVCRVEDGEALPDPDHPRAVVVTGSSALVTDRLGWSERTRAWLPAIVERETPLLAICYGHQLLADALGGEVGRNRYGREIGQIDVQLTDEGADDPLLGGLSGTLRVSSSHRQSVRRLPPSARRLGFNEADENQAYAVGRRAWGVQFHPEWDHGVIRAYLEDRVDTLREEGLDPDELLARVAPSPHGATVLRRFGELVD